MFLSGLKPSVKGSMGGGCDGIQYWDVGDAFARLFLSLIGGHTAWALELL